MGDITIERNPDRESINWQRLLDFIHTAFAYMDERIDPPSSLHRMDADDLRKKARVETLVLARNGNAIVGCMFCRDDGGFLYVGKVAVAPEWQGQGIGRRLFDTAFRMARESGMMGLRLETRIELTENRLAFEKMGFEKTGETAHDGYAKPTSITMQADID